MLAAALVAGVVAAYAPAARFEFINFDDPQYVTANPVVRDGLTWRGLGWALTQPHARLWHPLTTLSHMLDVTLFGVRPGPAHVVNVALHAAGTLACFGALAALTGRTLPSAAVAMLVAWHPARVESVAWIAERKDVLSMLFFWATIGAWTAWVRRPSRARFAAAFACFTAAVCSKSMMVTLPGVLLLLDLWPLGRLRLGWRRLVLEKVPFAVLAAVVAAITYHVQASGGAVAGGDLVAPSQRLANATVAAVRYLGLIAWPSELAIFYPYRVWPASIVAAAALVVAALTAGALALGRRAPWVTVGWLWYLLTLLPVSGIVQAGSQSMADRFAYLPSVGLAIALVWTLDAVVPRRRAWATALAVAAAASGVLLLVRSRQQVMTWRDSESVFRHALAVAGDNYLAHNQLGEALAAQGRFDEAVAHYEAAARLNPTYAEAQNNLGNARLRSGRLEDAEAYFRRALRLDPGLAEAHNGLGTVLAERGDDEAAVAEFRAALAIRPGYPEALLNLAHALRRRGAVAASADAYLQVIAVRPDWLDARLGLAKALVGLGHADQARATVAWVLERDPGYEAARELLAQLSAP
ncbi:MAG TPA: tetratricopeptide repeat protein [Candidatus Limnocylindria bacterium]|nr:tetratricopeptide repeat protein [Candidatus Limnocylindria bacterium]